MKKLTQDVFIGAPDWVKSAAVDGDGRTWLYKCLKRNLVVEKISCMWMVYGDDTCLLAESHDATNWQNSAIDREYK